jgi:hypothetical protein
LIEWAQRKRETVLKILDNAERQIKKVRTPRQGGRSKNLEAGKAVRRKRINNGERMLHGHGGKPEWHIFC